MRNSHRAVEKCWPRLRSICRSALAFVVAIAAAPLFAQPFVQRPESDLLLLAVRLNGEILNDSVPAFPLDRGVVLPLGELSRELGFAIDVDVANGTAAGFFISESRQFHLDARRGTVVVNGTTSTFDRRRVEVHRDDIYVDADLLSRWFPIDFTLDLYGSLLIVRPREPLPVQIRRERERQIEKTLAGLGYSGPKFPLIRNPYSLFSVPFIDEEIRLSRGPDATGRTMTDVIDSTVMSADLLGLEANMFLLAGTHDAVSDFRLGLGRRSPRPDLLGPLHAREFGVGEVLFPGSDLVALPASGPGFLVSNEPLQVQGQFDRHTFIGDLPIGWEVELYRNGALIAFQQATADGRYVFQNIPLLFGLNMFRLVFYGPQGQRRVRVETYNIGESLTPAGTLQYRVAANDPKSLTRRAVMGAAYGVSSNLTAQGTLSTLDLAGRGRSDYETASLRGFWTRLFAYTDLGRMSGGGMIARAGIDTRAGGLSIGLSRAQLRGGYESEIFRPIYGRISARTALRLGGLLQPKGVPAIPVTLDVVEDEIEGGRKVDQLSSLVSTMIGRTAITNRLDGFLFRSFPVGGAPQDSVAGALLVSRYLQHFSLRGEWDYEARPSLRSIAYAVTAETRILPRYLISATLLRANTMHFIGGISRDEGPFSFGVDADVSSRGGVLLRVALGVGIQRDPVSGRWRTSARSVAGQGAMAARVFLDTNGNGRWDPGEKAVSGAGFFVNRANDPRLTNGSGEVLLPNLPAYQDTDVEISQSTLEDPLWVAERPGVRIVPRPGNAPVVDFPIAITGEITGTVYVNRAGAEDPAPGVGIELVDAAGDVVKSEKTAYDGFYDLTNIRPGSYTLRIVPNRTLQTSAAARSIKIDPAGTILDGLNFVLGETKPALAGTPPPPTGTPSPQPSVVPATGASAVELVHRGDFRAALAAFATSPPADAEARYEYAVALYETGHYAEAKRELAASKPPETEEAARYRAKIEGAIVWRP